MARTSSCWVIARPRPRRGPSTSRRERILSESFIPSIQFIAIRNNNIADCDTLQQKSARWHLFSFSVSCAELRCYLRRCLAGVVFAVGREADRADAGVAAAAVALADRCQVGKLRHRHL